MYLGLRIYIYYIITITTIIIIIIITDCALLFKTISNSI